MNILFYRIRYAAMVLCAALAVVLLMRPSVIQTTAPAPDTTVIRQVQQKLADLGYDTGGVDGVYGPKTGEAVRAFQQAKGLTPDGIIGPQTLSALGISGSSGGVGGYTEAEIDLLTRIINGEARGEPYEGQVAVGAVVLNRVESPAFPNTIEGVIYQPGAFTAITDKQIDAPLYESSRRAALEALSGVDPTGGAVYYYNPAKTTNQWIYSRPVITRIQGHIFAR